jgi:hypothetical protein
MDDISKRRRTNRRSRVETERDAGLEVAAEWAKEDDKYRALLRIAKAVEEAKREIDKPCNIWSIPNTEWMRAIGSDFGKIAASAAIPNRAIWATEPSPMLQPGSSRKSEPNCNSKPVLAAFNLSARVGQLFGVSL